MKFYDREKEMAILRENEQLSREAASFTVLKGRRRIGKTSLVMQTFRDMDYAYLFVSRDSEAMLCQKFQHELSEQLGLTAYGSITRFRDLFEMVMRESTRRHFTVVIDEFQNLYRTNPAIFGEMQDVWDRHHRESRINLIVCGSIHSLMKRIFEDVGEPLYGRPTSKFTLHAFPTHVLRQIMADNAPTHQPDDLLCLYMLTGGVAKYVELLVDGKHLTKERMLDYVCRPDSYFLTEGRDLLSNEFTGEFSTYFSVLQLIAGGMTRRAEIDGFMQKDMGVYLNNLEKGYEMGVLE